MIDKLTFRFKQEVNEDPNRLTVTAIDTTGEIILDEAYAAESTAGVVAHPLFAAESVLRGTRTDLLKCVDADRWISVVPGEDTTVALDIRNLFDDSSYLDAPLPIAKETLLEALIEFADWYRHERADADPDPCALTRLDVGIADARRRLEYYREQHSQDGYEPTIDYDHLETFLLECRSRDRLCEFVAETGETGPFVRQLLDDDDDEYVETIYRQLFNREYDDIARQGLEVLREHPDERASIYLVGVALESDPSVAVPALEILSQADPELLIEIVREQVNSADPEIARAAIDALASLDAQALDTAERDRVVSHLQIGRQATDDETLTSRIDNALAKFE